MSTPATSLGTGQRGWQLSNIRRTDVVLVPTCLSSLAPAATTARLNAALLISASSSNPRNAVFPLIAPCPPVSLLTEHREWTAGRGPGKAFDEVRRK
ncbi:MAG: hypothetical protein ACRDRQ_03505 [Pseudonocardiaceae bacterium]